MWNRSASLGFAVRALALAVGMMSVFSARASDSPFLEEALAKPIIVIGRTGPEVSRRTQQDSDSSMWSVLDFSIERVVKGALPFESIEIRHTERETDLKLKNFTERARIPPNSRVLLFLGEPTDSDPAYPVPPENASLTIVLSDKPGAALPGASDLREIIAAEVLSLIEDPDSEVIDRGLMALGRFGVSNDSILRRLEELSAATDPQLAIVATAVQVQLGNASVLPALAADLKAWPTASSLPLPDIVGALRSVRDPGALASLQDILGSPDVAKGVNSTPVRRAAASAIARLEDDRVVPVLIQLLSDPDQMIQYEAVHGLYRGETGRRDEENRAQGVSGATASRLPGAQYAPGLHLFAANPTRYIENWQRWWETTGRQKYGPAS